MSLIPVFDSFEHSRVVGKVWGYEVWYWNTEKLCCKMLVIYPGHTCSDHMHSEKYEIFMALESAPEGRILITVNGEECPMSQGEHVIIGQGDRHSFRCIGNRPAALLELSTQHMEDDSTRFSVSHKFARGNPMEEVIGDVAKFSGKKVMAVGDICLDVYSIGRCERLSPEAPVPVLINSENNAHAGGVGNVAMNLKALGGIVEVVSVTGSSHQANGTLYSDLHESNIGVEYILQIDDRPTSMKTRFMSEGHYLLRVDDEVTTELTKSEGQNFLNQAEACISNFKPEVVYVADYDKGAMTRQTINGIREMCTFSQIPMIVDPKLRNFHLYNNVDILKPNDKRASAAMGMPAETESDLNDISMAITSRLNVHHLLLTRGKKGMYLRSFGEEPVHIPAHYVEVSELSGAGDTAGATLALGIAAGLNIARAAEIANVAASLVVQKSGTSVCTPLELAAAL